MIESNVGPLRVSSWIRWMRFAILPAFILTTNASVLADAICITSPNHPQTFTYRAMMGTNFIYNARLANWLRESHSVMYLMPATTNRAETNHSTFTFPVSNSIPRNAPFL